MSFDRSRGAVYDYDHRYPRNDYHWICDFDFEISEKFIDSEHYGVYISVL